MPIDSWEHRVLLFSIGCHIVLLWRLWSQKLAGVYPFLTMFLAAEMIQNLGLFPLNQNSTIYGWAYVLSDPIIWALAFGVVLELCRLILEDYPGIASVGRKAVSVCMGLALVIAAVYAVPALRTTNGKFPVLRIFYIAERSAVLSLLLFLVLIQLFLFRYKVQLSPNRMIYATGYALYFSFGVAEDIVFTSLGVRVAPAVSLWTVVIGGVVLLAGAVLLRRGGEVKVIHAPAGEDDARVRLQEQLVEMNRLLTRAARGRG